MARPGSSLHILKSLYPDALTRTYCVPPVHFNRVPYVRGTVPGTRHSALVVHPPSVPPARPQSALRGREPAHSRQHPYPQPVRTQQPFSGQGTHGQQSTTGQSSSGQATHGQQSTTGQSSSGQATHGQQSTTGQSSSGQATRGQQSTTGQSSSGLATHGQQSTTGQSSSGQATHGQQSTTGQSSSGPQSAQYSLWTPESVPPGTPVNVQQTDILDDFAQNLVMVNLQELGNSHHKEGMFILSQLNFGDYLNQPAYAAAAAQLPRPSDLDTQQRKYSDGEADFVLIHRQHGILIGELKTVGRWQKDVNKTQAQADADVAKKVTKAVNQLDRSETVVRHLVSGVAPDLTVRKTLFLPYVSTEQLKRVLDKDPQLEQSRLRG